MVRDVLALKVELGDRGRTGGTVAGSAVSSMEGDGVLVRLLLVSGGIAAGPAVSTPVLAEPHAIQMTTRTTKAVAATAAKSRNHAPFGDLRRIGCSGCCFLP